MRIAFYDGILETHVAASLERALTRRGHHVLNRGKFGHGFKFPNIGSDFSEIHAEIDEILVFDPDVVLVFRPALLPPEVIHRMKSRGIVLVAWFSDDPVLFDLSYGPVVTEYDLILHCGNEKILQYYEDFFGFPTGVNFPFWTDHESFPRLWSPTDYLSDAVFLGNVQDDVRRQRYFDLAKMQSSVRIHGNVGTDYFGLWGGFLDTEQEVASSLSKSRLAINIPQFFEDHYGLSTWFPDLDQLGFFEFPSRVIQYMAVGIPTVTLLPFEYNFETYPEMLVFHSTSEVDDYLRNVTNDELQSLSQRIADRFDRNFSAESRAIALENILEDNSWRRLDAYERSVWFTNFVPQPKKRDEPITDTRERVQLLSGDEDRTKPTSKTLKTAVIVNDTFQDISYAGIVSRALENLGHRVDIFEGGKAQGILTPDPSHVFKVAPSSGFVASLLSFDAVFFVGDEFSVTETSSKLFAANEVETFKISFSNDGVNNKRVRELSRFQNVLYTNALTHEKLRRRGFSNAEYFPPVVDATFRAATDRQEKPRGVVRIKTTARSDESLAPAYLTDVKAVNRSSTTSELSEMSLVEAAEFLDAAVTFLSVSGTRNSLDLGQIFPFVMATSQLTFVPRSNRPEIFWRWSRAVVQIRFRNEITAKSRLLAASGALLQERVRAREAVLQEHSAEDLLAGFISEGVSPVQLEDLMDRESFVMPNQEIAFEGFNEGNGPTVASLELLPPFVENEPFTLVIKRGSEVVFEAVVVNDIQIYIRTPADLSLKLLGSKNRVSSLGNYPVARLSVSNVDQETLAHVQTSTKGHVALLNTGY